MVSPAIPRILLLGGHGKVSLLLTPLLLSRGWHVTSMIRNPAQKEDVVATGAGQRGQLDVLVESLEDVGSVEDAAAILKKVGAEWIVWSAGAGGKGGPSRTKAIDSNAARYFIRASIDTPSITKFLLVSAISIRRRKAPWWTDEEWAQAQKVNTEIMPAYYKAKLEADECLTVLGERRAGFPYMILRPGLLTDGPPTGKVQLGHTKGRGAVSRADVADVAARLLETNCRGWFDLLAGEEDVGSAVERVVQSRVDSVEGEDLQEMERNL